MSTTSSDGDTVVPDFESQTDETLHRVRRSLKDYLIDTIMQQHARTESRCQQNPVDWGSLDTERAPLRSLMSEEGDDGELGDLSLAASPLEDNKIREASDELAAADSFKEVDDEDATAALFGHMYDHALRLLVDSSINVSADPKSNTAICMIPSFLLDYSRKDDPEGFVSESTDVKSFSIKKRELFENLTSISKEVKGQLTHWMTLRLGQAPGTSRGERSFDMPAWNLVSDVSARIQQSIVARGSREDYIASWMKRDNPLQELSAMDPSDHSIRPLIWLGQSFKPRIGHCNLDLAPYDEDAIERVEMYLDSLMFNRTKLAITLQAEDLSSGQEALRMIEHSKRIRQIIRDLESGGELEPDLAHEMDSLHFAQSEQRKLRPKMMMRSDVSFDLTLGELVDYAEKTRQETMSTLASYEGRVPTVALEDITLRTPGLEAARQRTASLSPAQLEKRLNEPLKLDEYLSEHGIHDEETKRTLLDTPLKGLIRESDQFPALEWRDWVLTTSNFVVPNPTSLAKSLRKKYKLSNEESAENLAVLRKIEGYRNLSGSGYGIYPMTLGLHVWDVGLDMTLEERLNLPMPGRGGSTEAPDDDLDGALTKMSVLDTGK